VEYFCIVQQYHIKFLRCPRKDRRCKQPLSDLRSRVPLQSFKYVSILSISGPSSRTEGTISPAEVTFSGAEAVAEVTFAGAEAVATRFETVRVL